MHFLKKKKKSLKSFSVSPKLLELFYWATEVNAEMEPNFEHRNNSSVWYIRWRFFCCCWKYRFRRQDIVTISDNIERDNATSSRTGSLTHVLQVWATRHRDHKRQHRERQCDQQSDRVSDSCAAGLGNTTSWPQATTSRGTMRSAIGRFPDVTAASSNYTRQGTLHAFRPW